MAPSMSYRKILGYFIILRVSSVFIIKTYFVPDEYWQSLEVAHRMVYSYGYLTWEWTAGVRNCLYPAIFAVLYKSLQLLNLDYRELLILLPRVFQAILSAVGDLYTVKLCQQMFGREAAFWTFLSLSASWFLFYCGSRTLTNTMETALTAVALYYYPWKIGSHGRANKKIHGNNVFWFLNLIGFSVMVRPTSAVMWLPLCVRHLWLTRRHLVIWKLYLGVGLYSLLTMLLLDRWFYGKWISTLYNFVQFNVIKGDSSFYGSHPFYWYWTEGFPVIMWSHLVPFTLEICRSFKTSPFVLIVWQLLIYSFIAHKEFRFIMPVLPLAMCLVGKYLASISLRNAKVVYGFLVVTNLIPALFLGLFHLPAPLQAINFLSKLPQEDNSLLILFLTPCHTTPLYSHLHRNISTRFITCEPNLQAVTNYSTEADVFNRNPLSFLQEQYNKKMDGSNFPTHVVLFDDRVNQLSPFLLSHNFRLCANFFHSYLSELGEQILVYCKER